jgi:methyl-accepting chemotaxis protein
VGDEIKDLAERAGASTKEIADLIKTIHSES